MVGVSKYLNNFGAFLVSLFRTRILKLFIHANKNLNVKLVDHQQSGKGQMVRDYVVQSLEIIKDDTR